MNIDGALSALLLTSTCCFVLMNGQQETNMVKQLTAHCHPTGTSASYRYSPRNMKQTRYQHVHILLACSGLPTRASMTPSAHA